jgi:rhodanese-related sulfurtransferase
MSEQAKGRLFELFAQVGKALSHPKRLELVDLLGQGERTVEGLADAGRMGLSTCSAHLQILKQAHVVATRREGTRIHYRLAGQDVAQLYAGLQSVAAAHSAEVTAARIAYLGPQDTEEVGREELMRRASRGEVIVLDVRPSHEYQAGHIPGAMSIPLEELPARLADLPEGEVVAYCRGAYCVFAHDAVRLLTSHGREARRLVEGMLEWRLAGLAVASGSAA